MSAGIFILTAGIHWSSATHISPIRNTQLSSAGCLLHLRRHLLDSAIMAVADQNFIAALQGLCTGLAPALLLLTAAFGQLPMAFGLR